MRHLIYVIAFTGRFEAMRKFYERGLALTVRRVEPDWAEFDTAGASFALHRMDDPSRQGIMLRFGTPDLDAALAEVRERGLEPEGETIEFGGGRLAQFWDADGNLITLLEPATPVPSGAGPPIDTVILNVGDMAAATAFYRDQFGLPVLLESSSWTEVDTGATHMSLHPRATVTRDLHHNAHPIVVGFDVPSLEELGRELAGRGLVYSAGPVEERQGRFAEVTDPDGHVVLFRCDVPSTSAAVPPGDDEDAAEPFEDSPTHTAMRQAQHQRAKATSRVAVKPEYHLKKPAKPAEPKHPAKAPEAKNNTRMRTKPATGRLKKAERRSAVTKQTALATTSRAKPVKHEVAKRVIEKRLVATRVTTTRVATQPASRRRAAPKPTPKPASARRSPAKRGR
ncbi:MAG: VOC family protein [Candidatus Eisenbacteria bacterium]